MSINLVVLLAWGVHGILAILAWLSVAATGLGILQGIDALAGTTWSTGSIGSSGEVGAR